MRCRSCGTEIADKALICYRCGTATTEAKFTSAVPKRRSSLPLVASISVLVVLAIVTSYLERTAAGATLRLVSSVAVVVAAILVAVLAYARHR